MLKKIFWIILTFVLSTVLAITEFFVFPLAPALMFRVHNLLALVVGALLAYYSYSLLEKSAVNKYLLYAFIIIGVGMSAIHVVKFFIATCI